MAKSQNRQNALRCDFYWRLSHIYIYIYIYIYEHEAIHEPISENKKVPQKVFHKATTDVGMVDCVSQNHDCLHENKEGYLSMQQPWSAFSPFMILWIHFHHSYIWQDVQLRWHANAKHMHMSKSKQVHIQHVYSLYGKVVLSGLSLV